MSPLKLINAMAIEGSCRSQDLMFVTALVDGQEVWTMVDTRANRNFISQRKADLLDFKVSPTSYKLKAVNFTTKLGVSSTMVSLKVASWKGQCDLSAVPLNDFDLVLGMDFIVKAKVFIIPNLRSILIGDESSLCFVKAKFLSAKQF